jgi:hypothetical protein
MPWPVLVLISVLLGYPLVQLASAVLARPQRRRVRELVTDIRSDPQYSAEDLSVLDWSVSTERPSLALSLVFPLIAPIAVLVSAWELLRAKTVLTQEVVEDEARAEYKKIAEFHQIGSSHSKIWRDKRFQEARHLAIDLEMMRLPLTVILSGLTALVVLPIAALAFGWNLSLPIREFLSETMRRAILAIHLGAESMGSRS